MKEAPHIGNMLRKYVKEKRIFQAVWARKQGIQPKNVLAYLKRPNMRIDTLFTICQILNYNFFKQISDALPPDMPPATEDASAARVKELEQRVHDLETEVKVLRDVVGVAGRK